MEEDRLRQAVHRVGTAMDRLEAVISTRPSSAPGMLPLASAQANPNEASLIAENKTMRKEVRESLAALDALISGLEK